MSSVSVQTIKDLAIPFSTLPFGDKNDYAHAKEVCQLWIETAASTAIAAGFFFANFTVLKGSEYAFDYIADIFDPTENGIYFAKFICENAFLYITPKIYSHFDSHAALLCRFAEHIYYGFQNYRSSHYLFLGINALFAAQMLKPRQSSRPIRNLGSWRAPIGRFAESWAPAMAHGYGYQEAPV
jgi:hypothetical protein